MVETFAKTLLFEVLTCCHVNCAIAFGIPEQHYRRLRESGESFYCPNGHSQSFAETEVMRLQKELDASKRNAERYRQQSETRARDRDRAQNQARAFKGVITKVKRRVSNGVCPCCQRTFQDLARHMHTKHPDYAKQELGA